MPNLFEQLGPSIAAALAGSLKKKHREEDYLSRLGLRQQANLQQSMMSKGLDTSDPDSLDKLLNINRQLVDQQIVPTIDRRGVYSTVSGSFPNLLTENELEAFKSGKSSARTIRTIKEAQEKVANEIAGILVESYNLSPSKAKQWGDINARTFINQYNSPGPQSGKLIGVDLNPEGIDEIVSAAR